MPRSLTSAGRPLTRIIPRVRTAVPRLLPFRWLAVWRERRALAALDRDALADIGVSREAANAEACRPFWDLPDNR